MTYTGSFPTHPPQTRHWRRLPLAVLLTATLLLTGCRGAWPTDSESGFTPVPAGTPADWHACPELLHELLGDVAPPAVIDQLTEQITYECAAVEVPQDWEEPAAGGTHEIALVRARSTAQTDRIGSLLVNPGGPGASGIEAAVLLSLGEQLGGLPQEVTARFDVVGFDPRGVGRSSPVECFTDAQLDASFGADPDPVDQAEFDAQVAEGRQQAEACAERYGDALATYSTRQTAHDLEALRAAVGDEQLTYLGYSYGSLLGATYAQLYPERLRAMVLDGAVDPEQDPLEAVEAQAAGFEQALDSFSDWCTGAGEECPLEPDGRTTVAEALAAARTAPVPGDDGRQASAGWVFLAVLAGLYSEDLWPRLAGALEQLQADDPSGIFELADAYTRREADGSYANMFDANSAITCADTDATGIDVAQVRQLQEQWREQYPVFGGPLAVATLGCTLWPADSDPFPTGPAEGAPPILVVGTLGDPATPYESTARLADMLGVGVTLTWEGEGHTAYPQTACIREEVHGYLIDLTVPEDGTTCPAE